MCDQRSETSELDCVVDTMEISERSEEEKRKKRREEGRGREDKQVNVVGFGRHAYA